MSATLYTASEASLFITITKHWVEEQIQIQPQNNSTEEETEEERKEVIISNNSQNSPSFKPLKRSKLSQQLHYMREHNNKLSKNKDFENAKCDLMEALDWRKLNEKFRKYIESSYDKCKECKAEITHSFDKIFLYSLLLSSAFIYYSDFGTNFMNGIRQIYYICLDITADTQLCKDIETALKKKIFFLSENEKKLINASLHLSVRLRDLIQICLELCHISDDSKSDDDAKTEPKYLKNISRGDTKFWSMDWLPNYSKGYLFGECTQTPFQFSIPSIKKFRKVMSADKEPYLIMIDDLAIHTNKSLAQTGERITQMKGQRLRHEWLSDKDWIDFTNERPFRIGIQIMSNGKAYPITNVHLYTTVKQIKTEISKREGTFTAAMLRIDWNGKRVKNENLTMFELGICEKGFHQFKVRLDTFDPFLNLVSK